MTSSASTRPAPRGARTTFAVAAGGGAGIMGMIPLTAVAGEWWVLGATFALLVGTAALVVAGFFALLEQSGDPVAADGAATSARDTVAVGPAGERRRLTRPILRSA